MTGFERLEQRQLLATDCVQAVSDGADEVVTAPLASATPAGATESATAVTEVTLELPSDLPAQFSTGFTYDGATLTLEFEKNTVFGENTRFLLDDGSGELVEVDHGPDGTYLGRVAEFPEYSVVAVLGEAGLRASVTRPGISSLAIEPMGAGSEGSGRTSHRIVEVEVAAVSHDHDGDGVPDHAPEDHPSQTGGGHPPGCGCASCCVAASEGPVADAPAASETDDEAPRSEAATLAPSRVVDVYEYEVGVEISSRAFVNNYGSNLALAQSVAQGIAANMDARYLHSTGIKHRVGTVIIRTNPATDPINVANGNDNAGLDAFRDYWNNNPGEVGTTHDLAVYHVQGGPSGLAYVNAVGTSNRYALSASNGATSWADGTLAHEFGHTWGLPHVNVGISQGFFYESKPRSNGNAAGGQEVFISPMDGRGEHNIGRLSTDEANSVYNVKLNKLQFGDLISNPDPIRPFGHRDEVQTAGVPVVIDVIANDYDANNDVLNVQLRDTVSQQGGTISLSVGTGPGGRDELTYTPPAAFSGSDFFHYNVIDSTGRFDWGAVNVTVNPEVEVAYQFDFGVDGNPAYNGTNAPGGLGVGENTWNLVTKTTATQAGTLDAEGNVSGVGIKLREAADGTPFDFSVPASGLEGIDGNYSGFYSSDLLSNVMFTRDDEDFGVQVTGLPSGVYTVYTVSEEPLQANRTYSVDIGTGSTDTPTFGDFGLGNETVTPGTVPSSWVEGQNYYVETVSLYEGESLYVLMDSLNSDFISLQGLQILKIGDVDPSPLNVYQFDFGPTNNGVTSGASGPATTPGQYTVWNGFSKENDELIGVNDGVGNLSNVDVRVREVPDGQVLDFNASGSPLEDTDGNYAGFYSSDLFSDVIFSRDDADLGVQVSGLVAGEYDVYFIALEPNNLNRTYSVDIGVSSSDTVSHGDFGLGHLSTPGSAPSEWVEGVNYYIESVSVATGESIYVLMDSINDQFAILQGLQIAQRSIATPPPELPGDYNLDQRVDSADYTVWRDQEGTAVAPYSGADGNGDGTVSSADYDVWKNNYGRTQQPSMLVAQDVPETAPSTSESPQVTPNARDRAFAGYYLAPLKGGATH